MTRARLKLTMCFSFLAFAASTVGTAFLIKDVVNGWGSEDLNVQGKAADSLVWCLTIVLPIAIISGASTVWTLSSLCCNRNSEVQPSPSVQQHYGTFSSEEDQVPEEKDQDPCGEECCPHC